MLVLFLIAAQGNKSIVSPRVTEVALKGENMFKAKGKERSHPVRERHHFIAARGGVLQAGLR